MVVFLGGTCNGDNWREWLIPQLEERGIKYFNPIVENWDREAQKKEDEIKEHKDTINLFFITSKMKGVYSIAEVVQCSNLDPSRTIFCYKEMGFDDQQIHSLEAVGRMISVNGARWCTPGGLPKLIEEAMDGVGEC